MLENFEFNAIKTLYRTEVKPGGWIPVDHHLKLGDSPCHLLQGEPAPEIRWTREGAEEAEQEVCSDRAKAVTLSSTADETKLVSQCTMMQIS